MHSYWQGKRVIVTGANGFVGRHLTGALMAQGCVPFAVHSREYDLRDPSDVVNLFIDVPDVDVLFHLAANVGGIGANQKSPANMYADNVRMDTILIQNASAYGVKCFVGMGSVCAYPKHAPIPFKEETLWDGYPEETNAAYGMAKRGMLACLQAYGMQYGLNWRYALSTNLYGPGDEYGERGHVIAHLIRRFTEAVNNGYDEVEMWGTGKATRDFLYVSDVVSGLMLMAEYGKCEPVNLGSGRETSIRWLSKIITETCGYEGLIYWNTDKPDGQPRRVLDITRAQSIHFNPRVELEAGIRLTLDSYKEAAYA